MTQLGSYDRDNLIAGAKRLIGEDVLIQSGLTLVRGTVLGKVKVSVPTSGTAAGGNTGNGTVTLVSGGGKTKRGTYTIKNTRVVTNGGEFSLTDPDGKFVGSVLITAGAGGTGVFKSDELNFTITDGGTDFALADSFTVAVSDGVPATGTADGGNTGNGTLTLVEGRRGTRTGTYTLECTTAVTNGGVFKLTDPDGNDILTGITITPGAGASKAFDCDELAGTVTDGSTDFAVGDKFTVAVSIDPHQCVAVNSANSNGSSEPYAVLSEDVDASAAAVRSIGYIEGSFNERALVFGGSDTIDDHRETMRDLGMITVPSIPAGAN